MDAARVSRVNGKLSRYFAQVCKRWQLYLFLVIPVAYILIFAYYPMIGVQIAFKNFVPRKGIWGSDWVGFKHYQTFFCPTTLDAWSAIRCAFPSTPWAPAFPLPSSLR